MINIFQPSVGDESLRGVGKVFESNWLGRGQQVLEFENNLCRFLSVDSRNIHTIACATDAIFGIFRILENGGRKNEVIVPSISFPAVASSVLEAGLTPVIVDVDAFNGNASLDAVKEALSESTLAVFVTHYGGIPVDVKKLRQLVGDEVYILEDAACAFGTFVDGKACGTLGDFGCWSFDPMKMLVTGEGGACHFADRSLANKAREYFYLGLPSSDKSGLDKASDGARWWEYQLVIAGRRSLFSNVNAAIGLPQFLELPQNFKKRENIRRRYCEAIDANDVLQYSEQNYPNVQYSNYFFTVLSDRRDDLANYLKASDVYTTFRYFPLHKIDLFSQYTFGTLSGATEFSETALNIPIHHNLTSLEVDSICRLIRDWR